MMGMATEYGAITGHSVSTIAHKAAGDWRFFDRLGAGACFSVRKYDSVVTWFLANWPANDRAPLTLLLAPGGGVPFSTETPDGAAVPRVSSL